MCDSLAKAGLSKRKNIKTQLTRRQEKDRLGEQRRGEANYRLLLCRTQSTSSFRLPQRCYSHLRRRDSNLKNTKSLSERDRNRERERENEKARLAWGRKSGNCCQCRCKLRNNSLGSRQLAAARRFVARLPRTCVYYFCRQEIAKRVCVQSLHCKRLDATNIKKAAKECAPFAANCYS